MSWENQELPQDMNPPLTMDNSTIDNNTTASTPPGEDAEGVASQLLSDKDRFEMTAWAIGCGAITFFFFMLATVQYIRKVMTTPEAKRKRKKIMHKRKRALEEKAISETSSAGPIPLADFPKSYKKKRDKGLLTVEFKAVGRKAEEGSVEIASHPDNACKNAHPDALPYDHCLIDLTSPPASSTYVNASYIDSYDEKKVYIAAQGPCRGAIGDFWHLVWQQNVRVIVMATNVFEHARQQCEKYWHNQHARYDGVDVWLESTDILADFSVRSFKIKLEGSSEERIVKHFQFASWSDHDCPNPSSVLECRRRVRVFMAQNPGPMLVHCGAGAGRTGAFIAIDCALEQVTQRKGVDIFNYVLYLRSCRQHMVRDVNQYEFIYSTVDMFIQCGETVIGLRELPHVVKSLAGRVPGTRMNGFEQEFKTLQKVVSPLSVGECAGGHRSENRRKSRDIMLQPPERARPYLITHDSNDSTDYINAVYVDGYRDINAFIVTQWPMKSTINDVWRLVYDYNIPSLVLLNDTNFSRTFPCFWPRVVGVPTSFGPLTIELVEENVDDHIASRLFKIKKTIDMVGQVLQDMGTLVSLQAMAGNTEESFKLVRMFQLRCWPNNHKVPTSANALLELLSRVDDWQRIHCHGRIPTLVISKNGVSRCGCYCAISHAWEKLKMEGEVDIFRAVKNIKTNRPMLVENLKEYKLIYKTVDEMVSKLREMMPDCEFFREPEPTKGGMLQQQKQQAQQAGHRGLSRSITPDNYPKKPRVNRLQPEEGSKRARDMQKAEEDRLSTASSRDVCIEIDMNTDSDATESVHTLKSNHSRSGARSSNSLHKSRHSGDRSSRNDDKSTRNDRSRSSEDRSSRDGDRSSKSDDKTSSKGDDRSSRSGEHARSKGDRKSHSGSISSLESDRSTGKRARDVKKEGKKSRVHPHSRHSRERDLEMESIKEEYVGISVGSSKDTNC